MRFEANFATSFSSLAPQVRLLHTTENFGELWIASFDVMVRFDADSFVNSDGPSPSTSSLRPEPPLSAISNVGKIPSFNSMPI